MKKRRLRRQHCMIKMHIYHLNICFYIIHTWTTSGMAFGTPSNIMCMS